MITSIGSTQQINYSRQNEMGKKPHEVMNQTNQKVKVQHGRQFQNRVTTKFMMAKLPILTWPTFSEKPTPTLLHQRC
mgnify:CR=1 FL=1